jgi:cell wall-associated NlpC family hydrolase
MDIKKFIGTPFRTHGRTLEEGLDCYGLALLIFRERGIKLPDLPYFDTETATNRRIMDSLEKTIPNIPLTKPEPFCVIEFMVLGEPAHIGVYLEYGKFIHASRSTGVVIDRLYRWSKRVKGYYRITA